MTLTPLNAIRERAEKARKLVEAATPGPWEKSDEYGIVQIKHITRDLWVIPRIEEDLNFIAASPTLVRELLDDIERLSKAVELLRDRLDEATQIGVDRCADNQRWNPLCLSDVTNRNRLLSQIRDQHDSALAAILEPKVTP